MTERSSPEERLGPAPEARGDRAVAGSTLAGAPGAGPGHHNVDKPWFGARPMGEAYHPFGSALEPVLRQVCGGSLSPITWFRTDWQRGGAATGYASFEGQPVVVKLPVTPGERQWLLRLQDFDGVVPRLGAHGERLDEYDIAWVVMERLPHGPIGSAWHGREFDLLIEAAGRFYAAAIDFPVPEAPPEKDWHAIFDKSRQCLKRHNLHHEQRWKEALKHAHRKLKHWLQHWEARRADQWCHGDLHLANAMTRCPPPEGPAVLLDFANTHVGHWVEDAVYFEHLFWARRQRLGGRRLCSMIAHERKKRGLWVDSDWPRLASIRRALLALSTPAMLEHDGDPLHVQAALEVLEIELGGGGKG